MEKIFVLVHGSWHGAWCFERVTPLLVRAGDRVIARDLPGHGLSARFPESYAQRPLDPEKFATEPSPLGQITQDEYAETVIAEVNAVSQQFPGVPITLVGHSFGGVTVTRVGEAMPEAITRMVYLAAFMVPNGTSVNDVIGAPEFATSMALPLLLSDPAATGALRIGFNSPDTTYQAKAKEAFAGDVSDAQWAAVTHLLTPDEPAQPVIQPLTVTKEKWGSVPRTYIKTNGDQAIPVAAQQAFIEQADQLTPENKTDVRVLETSHSPFLSSPAELARLLRDL